MPRRAAPTAKAIRRRATLVPGECLERRRVLAASYSFLDQFAHVVTITTSLGTDAKLAAALSFTAKSAFTSYLDVLELQDPAFAGTNLTITAKTVNKQPVTVDVGKIGSVTPFGTVFIDGDVERITANFGQPNSQGPAAKSVHVTGSIGVAPGAGESNFRGSVGSLVVDGSIADVVRARSIGTLTVGGSLVGGGAADQGSIVCTGAITGPVTVGGSLFGGVGPRSGSIVADSLGAVTVVGFLQGGGGAESGCLTALKSIGKVTVHDIHGGTADRSGRVWAQTGGIAGVTVQGSILGTGKYLAGSVEAEGSIGPVVVGVSIVGGQGQASGSIESNQGSIGSVSVGVGGLVRGSGFSSGVIVAPAGIGKISMDGDLDGRVYVEGGGIAGLTIKKSLTGEVSAPDGAIGAVSVGGNVGKGTGEGTVVGRSIGPVTVGGDVDGGAITAGPGGMGMVSIAGSLRGGSTWGTGTIESDGGAIAGVTVGGDVIGGADARTGRIAGKTVGKVSVKSLQGMKGTESGAIAADGALGVVTIAGGISGGAGADSGSIVAGGSIAGVKVGSYVAGGAGPGSGSIRAGGVLQSLSVTSGMTGFGPQPLVVTATGVKGAVAMPSIKVGGALTRVCVLAGYDPFSMQVVNGAARIGSVTVGSLSASSIVAGVSNPLYPRFGNALDVAAGVAAVPAIASITVVGAASGSADPNETFAFVATSFGQISVSGVKIPPPSKNMLLSIGTPVSAVKNLYVHRL